MVTADEHFDRTLDEFRRPARTKHTVDFDPESIRFSKEEIAYVRLFAFFLSSLLFFFLSPCARALRKRRNKNNTRAQRVNSSFFLSRSSIADAFLFVSPSLSLLGAQVYGGEVPKLFHRV